MTLLYAAASLLFLAVMGMTVVDIGAADTESTSNAFDTFQAEANSTAGMEWAKWRLDNGQDPRSLTPIGYAPIQARIAQPADGSIAAPAVRYVIGPAPFGGGTFEVTSDPANGSVTSIGQFGAATVSHTMLPTYAAECFEFFGVPDFDFSGETEGDMREVGFRLHCPEDCAASDSCIDTVIIKAMSVSWTRSNDRQAVEAIIIDDASPAVIGDETVAYNRDAGNGWDVKGLPETGAASGTIINVVDYVLDDNEDHLFSTFDFQYDAGYRPESPDDFTVTVYFKDGSTESVTYPYLRDEDSDGIPDDEDNCPQMANEAQYDRDDDGLGNICDDDDDNDWIPDDDDDDDAPPPGDGLGDPEGECMICADEQQYPNIEGGIDPCMIGDDMGAEGGDGCASDGDPADTPGDCPGCDDGGNGVGF